MPVHESIADVDIIHLCGMVMRQYRGDLREAGVTVTLVMARDYDRHGEPTGKPAVKLHGTPAAATIRINNAKARLQGHADCTITIDHDRWDELTTRQREALLSHELTHVKLAIDKKGNLRRDNLGRPKLKMIPDDFAITGFNNIVETFGLDALEVQSVLNIENNWRQNSFDFWK